MQRPSISVVIPVYQAAEYLPQALRSVLDQTYPQDLIEIVVVDDGSTDDIAQAIAPFADRILYLWQPNAGVAAAENTGIAAASGDYVALLGADDYWYAARLEAMVAILKPGTPELIATDFCYSIDGRIEDVGVIEKTKMNWLFDLPPREQFLALLDGNAISGMAMIPRAVFSLVGNFDTSLQYGEDYDLWLRCLHNGIPIRLVPKPLAVYRYLRPGASTARGDLQKRLRKAENRVRVLSAYRSDVPRLRWLQATGELSLMRLKSALSRCDFRAAAASIADLARNPSYLRVWAADIWRRKIRHGESLRPADRHLVRSREPNAGDTAT